MRLINADKVKAESREHCKTCVLNGTKHCDKTCVINLICDRLDLQPTIEERKQGEWIFSRCDKCGAYHDGMYRNFCPNCGADMRGEEE